MAEPKLIEKEIDDGAVMGTFLTEHGKVEFASMIEQDGDTLYLRQLHVYGRGPNTVGIRALRGYVTQLARSMGASRVVIEGADRVTGAIQKAGGGSRTPRQLIFNVEDS